MRKSVISVASPKFCHLADGESLGSTEVSGAIPRPFGNRDTVCMDLLDP